ncbi:MAG TPA: hypothetical protein ENI11_03450 [Actinobacteria bacterium]|nr:hypothetical protein [Actinomycetota bacterium]
MFVFPLLATVISLIFAGLLLRQYAEKKKPYQLVWSMALVMFGIGALAETLATLGSWNEILVKLYYLFGGTLVVGYLGLGTLYVSGDYDAGSPLATFFLGRRFNTLISTSLTFFLWLMIYGRDMFRTNSIVALVVTFLYLAILLTAIFAKEKVPSAYLFVILIGTALAIFAVSQGAIADPSKLAETEGWRALGRTRGIKTGAFSLNVIGSFLLIIGAIQSSISLIRKHIMRQRAVGNILIAAGVLVVAAGGTLGGLLRLGGQAAISIPMAVGVTIMFFGFLETGRATPPSQKPRPVTETSRARGR